MENPYILIKTCESFTIEAMNRNCVGELFFTLSFFDRVSTRAIRILIFLTKILCFYKFIGYSHLERLLPMINCSA